MFHELLVHILIKIDRMRIAQRLHHAIDGSIHELCIVHILHIFPLDELHRTKKTRGILRLRHRKSHEPAQPCYGEQRGQYCSNHDDQH